MTSAARTTTSSYLYYNCHKCGMSLTGPDTKLRFHPRDTLVGSCKTFESSKEVIFPPPYTGKLSSTKGLKIYANEKKQYTTWREGDGDFSIKFLSDGSYQIERDQHIHVPLPKLSREELVALWEEGKSFYMSDVNHEDYVWLLDPLRKAPTSVSSVSTSSEKGNGC